MNHVYTTLRERVKHKDWNRSGEDGLKELFENKLDVVLINEPLLITPTVKPYCPIQRNGDMVVGFYLDANAIAPTSLQLTIGGIPLQNLDIHPGEFAYTFEDTHVFPLISIVYSELHIVANDYSGLYVIYALLKDDLRRKLACEKHVLKLNSGKIAVCRGGFGYCKDVPLDIFNDVPNMREG